MKHTYRYMQMGNIKPVSEWGSGGRNTILNNINLQYMGSAEFEFGALPKALGRLVSSSDPMVFGKIQVNLPENPVRPKKNVDVLVRYYVRQSQEQDLVELLSNWTAASRNFKEWNVKLTEDKNVVFCIDKGYECFMWNGKLGKRLLTTCIAESTKALIKNDWLETELAGWMDDVSITGKDAESLLRVK